MSILIRAISLLFLWHHFSDFGIRIIMTSQNVLGIIHFSSIFCKSLNRGGINSSLNVIKFTTENIRSRAFCCSDICNHWFYLFTYNRLLKLFISYWDYSSLMISDAKHFLHTCLWLLYLLWKNVYWSPLLIFKLGCFTAVELCWFLIHFGYWSFIRYIICRYFLLIRRLPFSFVISFAVQKLFNLV